MNSRECRICSSVSNLFSVFNPIDEESICDKIKMIANVRVSVMDNLPKLICINCIGKVNNCVDFKRQIKFSHRIYYNPDQSGGSDDILSVPETSDHLPKDSKYDNKPLDTGPGAQAKTVEVNRIPSSVEVKRIPSPIPCDQCDFVSTTERVWYAHKESHITYKCNICSKVLASRKSLKQHKAIHTGVKSFFCSTCGKAFYTLKTMKEHARVVHKRSNLIPV